MTYSNQVTQTIRLNRGKKEHKDRARYVRVHCRTQGIAVQLDGMLGSVSKRHVHKSTVLLVRPTALGQLKALLGSMPRATIRSCDCSAKTTRTHWTNSKHLLPPRPARSQQPQIANAISDPYADFDERTLEGLNYLPA